MKSRRSKACDFSKKEREAIIERDSVNGRHCCIFCGNPSGLQIAHYIPRSAGGLGIRENGACACIHCHAQLDSGSEIDRFQMKDKFRKYLDKFYPFFTDEMRTYRKEGMK